MARNNGVIPTPGSSAAATLPIAATPPLRVVPDEAMHTLSDWQLILGLPRNTLKREARLHRLRVAKRAGKLWALGSWVREWLEGGEVRRRARLSNAADEQEDGEHPGREKG